jgi:hypothetical protein
LSVHLRRKSRKKSSTNNVPIVAEKSKVLWRSIIR